MSTLNWSRRTAAALTVLAYAGPAAADEQPLVELSAEAAIVSDYRFRGVSLSDRDAAVQGGIEAALPAGLFAGVWGSSIADYGGATTEVDAYAGLAHNIGGTDLSIAGYAYLYPGGTGVDYFELQATASRAIGPVEIGAEISYAPDQDNVASDNLYLGANLSHSLAALPLTLVARAGHENGFYDHKWNWEVGIVYAVKNVEFSASYVDTNRTLRNGDRNLTGATVVGAITARF